VGPKIIKRIPMRRAGKPEEIGPLAVYLASDDASFVTGEVFGISGGEMAQ
jgi:glucose 1-dehydrogenase